MGLFKPAWMSDDWKKEDKALKEVKKENDQIKLSEIAKYAPSEKVCEAAVEKLFDQSALADVAKTERLPSHRYVQTRRNALKKITEQSVLVYIAKNDNDIHMRIGAMDKITDQSVIANVAKNSKDYGVRWEAVNRLADQPTLIHIAEFDENEYVRDAAEKRIADPSVLAGLVEKRKRASKKELREIALTGKHWNDREEAVKYMKFDYELCMQIARTDKEGRVVHAAYNSIIFNSGLDSCFAYITDNTWPYRYRCDCLASLSDRFGKELNPDGVAFEKYDEAIKTLIEDAKEIPENICSVARAIPSNLTSEYGFALSSEEYDSEDSFGRYTSSNLYVTYKGIRYKAY